MNSRVIAFGDIHGCFEAAATAVKLAVRENAKAIFLGDYVDRGPNSIKTLKILLEAKKKNPNWVFIRGNHDQMLLDLILGITQPNTEFNVPNGLSTNEETTKVYYKLKKHPNTLIKQIVSFLNGTLFYHETENWIFVHAPLKDSLNPLCEKPKEELIWNYDLDPIWNGKPFIHGHAPVKEIVKINKGTNINTFCGYGGQLTGMLIEETYPFPINKPSLIQQKLIAFSISESGVLL